MIVDILRAEEVMNVWIVVMIILLGIGVLTLHRYDVWRVLILIALGWFMLGAFLLGYRASLDAHRNGPGGAHGNGPTARGLSRPV
jgi:hypothetical protein